MRLKARDILSSIGTKSKEFGIDIGSPKHAGEIVTANSSVLLDTVYSCVRDKSESIGQLPVIIKKDGKILAPSRLAYRIMGNRPNEFQTIQDFVEMTVTTLETRGNFYALPLYNENRFLRGVIPFFNQDAVTVATDLNGRVYYSYSTNDGKPAINVTSDQIIHIKLNSMNGYKGLSPISCAAKTIGTAMSQETYLASLMENGAMPKGILTTPETFTDDGPINRIKEQWKNMVGGARKAGSTPILENGLTYTALSISPADADLIKQRMFSRVQLCAIHRVPGSRVGVSDANNYKTAEENNKAYLRDSLIPIITKLESAISEKMGDGYEWKLDVTKFARGDRKSLIEGLAKEFTMGAISVDEFRVGADREPLGEDRGGNLHAIDTNNLTFGLIEDIMKSQKENSEQEPSQEDE